MLGPSFTSLTILPSAGNAADVLAVAVTVIGSVNVLHGKMSMFNSCQWIIIIVSAFISASSSSNSVSSVSSSMAMALSANSAAIAFATASLLSKSEKRIGSRFFFFLAHLPVSAAAAGGAAPPVVPQLSAQLVPQLVPHELATLRPPLGSSRACAGHGHVIDALD